MDEFDRIEQAIAKIIELEREAYFSSLTDRMKLLRYLKSIYMTDLPEDKVQAIIQAFHRARVNPFDYEYYAPLISSVKTSHTGNFNLTGGWLTYVIKEADMIIKSVLKIK